MEIFPAIFLFVAVMSITVVLFGGWVIFTITRLVFRGINALLTPTLPPRQLPASAIWTCGQPGCRAANPSQARFCRRCGRAVVPQQQVKLRRVAAMV